MFGFSFERVVIYCFKEFGASQTVANIIQQFKSDWRSVFLSLVSESFMVHEISRYLHVLQSIVQEESQNDYQADTC